MKLHTATPSRIFANLFLITLIAVFLLTMTIFIVEVSKTEKQDSILKVIWNSHKVTEEKKIPLVNIDEKSNYKYNKKVMDENKKLLNESERWVREAVSSAKIKSRSASKIPYYYEEQSPVVVHSETKVPTVTSYKQPLHTPSYSADEQQQYQDDYQSPSSSVVGANYYDNEESYDDHGYEGRLGEGYTANNKGRTTSAINVGTSDKSSSNGIRPYNAFYRSQQEWPSAVAAEGYRKLEPARDGQRGPFEYDYPTIISQQYRRPTIPESSLVITKFHPNHQQITTEVTHQKNGAENFLSIFNTLKVMWNIYQSFTKAWNTLAEHRQKQDDLIQEKIKKQKLISRINSKKPAKIGNGQDKIMKSNDTSVGLQVNLTETTTTRPYKTTKATDSTLLPLVSSMDELKRGNNVKIKKIGKKTGEMVSNSEIDGKRSKRQSTSYDSKDSSEKKDVVEGRYIKGDPLKGYYDFVITEGSYKFWAVFQVGTALLIIYSTFAAIYYSKVNPLTSDYDYTDYLGGARSLSDGGAELDFVDDDDGSNGSGSGNDNVSIGNRWKNFMPRVGHSLKFILDAIDKIPSSEDDIGVQNKSFRFIKDKENIVVSEGDTFNWAKP